MRGSLVRLTPLLRACQGQGSARAPEPGRAPRPAWAYVAGIAGAGLLAGVAKGSKGSASGCEVTAQRQTLGAPVATNQEVPKDGELRVISLKELRSHNNLEEGLWISYHGHVYDVTNFAKIHPGGPGRIQMAAGSDLQSISTFITCTQTSANSLTGLA